MENRSKIYLVLLSFLPILLYPVSVEFSLIIAVGLVVLGMEVVKDKLITKQMLRPLVLLIAAATVVLAFTYLFAIINGFGDLSNAYLWGGFRRFLFDFLDIVRTLLFILMVVASVFIGLSYKTNKPVWMLDKVVDGIMNGSCPFKKAKAEPKKQSKKQPKETETPTEEVVVETEDKKE